MLKPFSDRRFSEAIQRAKRRVRERRLGALANQLATLSSELRPDDQPQAPKQESPYAERLSFKQDDRMIYVRIHSTRGRYLVRTALATLEARLNPRDFVRVHRGAIVNVHKVAEVRDAGGLTIVLHDGTEVPTSRSRRAAVESSFLPPSSARRSH